MKIHTIGFTKKGAASFFGLLKKSKVNTLIDVRLNNKSQLAGFAKKDDLKYFLRELCNAEYIHNLELAPTKELLMSYKKRDISWQEYADKFLDLMSRRNVERTIPLDVLNYSCLLCSEHEPHLCHRSLVSEYLNLYFDKKFEVIHLV
jgi:uncharacterized protein (DUF488 family)